MLYFNMKFGICSELDVVKLHISQNAQLKSILFNNNASILDFFIAVLFFGTGWWDEMRCQQAFLGQKRFVPMHIVQNNL